MQIFCSMLVSTQKVCSIKIYSTEHFCNTEIAGIGEIFVQCKILTIQYYSPVPLGIATMHSRGVARILDKGVLDYARKI